jgi:hypothetical protein
VYGYYYFENYIIDLTNKNAICLHDTDSIAYWAGDDIVLMNEGGINTDYGSLTTMEINGDIVIGSLRAEQYVKLLDTQEDALLYVYPDILHIADDVYQISSQLLLINNIKLDNEIVLTDQFNWFNTAKFNAEGSKIIFVAVPKNQGEGVAKLYLLNL